MKITRDLRLKNLVTPRPDRCKPVYRWFLMKESFSSDLVHLLIKSWHLGRGDFVHDPFCGAGTTLLACKEHGIDSLGYEVHPVLFFASRVKTRNYNVADIRAFANEILNMKFEKVDIDATGVVERLFPKNLLEDIAFFRWGISKIDKEDVREFLLLAIRNAMMHVGGVYKNGAVLRKGKTKGSLRAALKVEVEKMLGDLEIFQQKECSTKLEFRDARETAPERHVSAIITSPPYPLKEEYVTAYRLEEWLFGTCVQNPRLFLNISPPEGSLEESAERYF
ncbi:MAG: DNA methyltransferase, partial [Candidatus Hadarchaeales archaeon]